MAYKYSSIAVKVNGTRVLMDNHSPKGHHYHINEEEFSYLFQTLDKLLEDFRALVKDHLEVAL